MRIALPERPVLTLMLFSQGAVTDRQFWWAVRTKDGRQIVGSQRLTPAAGISGVVTASVPISEGELEYASVRSLDDGEAPGTCWCSMRLNESQIPAPGASTPILSGWASFVDGPTWPTHPQWPSDGLGSPPVIVAGAAPAAGVNPTLALPGCEVTEVLQARTTLTSTATVANRIARLETITGSVVHCRVLSTLVQTASQALVWSWYRGSGGELADAGTASVPRVVPMVPVGATLAVTTYNLQGADAYGALQAGVRWRPVGF